MDEMHPGLKALEAEIAQLIAEALKEKMESEEFQECFDGINQKMLDGHGRVVGALALNLLIVTMPAEGGEKSKKPGLSLNFRFGQSEMDKEMGKLFGLGEIEMNQYLEQARREMGGRKAEDGTSSASTETAPQPPEETAETVESADPRNISQVINSIRAIAKSLNLKQRKFLIRVIKKDAPWLLQQGTITDEQAQNDTVWLRGIQRIVSAITNEAGRFGRLREELKEALLLFETAVIIAGKY